MYDNSFYEHVIIKEESDSHSLDEYVIKNPNDKRMLFYSCLLYDGMSKDFWIHEIATAESYNNLIEQFKNTKLAQFPLEIAIECTTYCNAKCTNCTHEDLINSGGRPLSMIDLEEAKYRIRKAKLLSLLGGGENPSVSPVGLGEPLCHPDMIDILNYMTCFFDSVSFTTNASLMTDEIAKKLSKINLEHIQLSLSYWDCEKYEKNIKLNQKVVKENIIRYLKYRNSEKKNNTKVIIHVFENTLNTDEDIKNFRSYFAPYMRDNDNLGLMAYIEFNKNEIKSLSKINQQIKPCFEMWHVLMIDVKGATFPCCMGVWKEHDNYLCLGNIHGSLVDIANNLIALRRKQLVDKNYGSCILCETIHHNRKFQYPMRWYNIEKTSTNYITEKWPLLFYIKMKSEIRVLTRKIKRVLKGY